MPLPPWFQPSASASWSLVRTPLSCVSGHESTMWPIVCHWPQSQHSGAARPHFCKLAQYGPWSVHKQCLGLAWQVEARLLDVRVVGRMLDADWPQEPTMSSLPTAFSFWWVLLLPKWGNEMWVTAHDGKHWVSRLADSLLPGVVPGFSTAMTLACRHSQGTCCPGPVMTLEEKVESHVMSLGPKLCLSNSRRTLSYPGAVPFFIWLKAGQLDSQNQMLVANCTWCQLSWMFSESEPWSPEPDETWLSLLRRAACWDDGTKLLKQHPVPARTAWVRQVRLWHWLFACVLVTTMMDWVLLLTPQFTHE